MFFDIINGIFRVLSHVEIWLMGGLWGLLLLKSVNFLAHGYEGDQSFFSRILAVAVFTGVGIFFLMTGPIILFGFTEDAWLRFWFNIETNEFVWKGGAIALGIGLIIAFITRITLSVPLIFSCYNEVLVILAAIAYFGTGGQAQIIPGVWVLVTLGLSGVFFVYVVDLFIEYRFPKIVTRTSIALSPLLIFVASAPYASWLRLTNSF